MRIVFNIIAFLCLCASTFAQNVELIHDETRETSYQGKSYLVVKQFKLKPPINGNFKVSAATHGPFFIKMAAASKVPTNIPPSSDKNFVRTEKITVEGITSEDAVASATVTEKNVQYEYLDEFGRPAQSVSVQTTPQFKDIITPYEYDNFGRMPRKYLPYSANQANGAYRNTGVFEQLSFYTNPPSGVDADIRPFDQREFENSPLERVVTTYGGGAEWKNDLISKGVKTLTKVNLASEAIIKWKHYVSGYPESEGDYSSNQLLAQETTDEEGQITKVYQNFSGQVVLKRVGDGSNWFDTYYLYSPDGTLTLVIQPEGVVRLQNEFFGGSANKQSFLNRWCFQYQYDDEHRLVAKRIPGWQPGFWTYTIYDKWDRPVFTQTPSQRERNEWLFTKYDRFNRVVVTGLYNSSADRATLQSNVNTFYTNNPDNRFETDQSSSIGYSLGTTYPPNPAENSLIVINYYDNYAFKSYSQWDLENSGSYEFENITGFPQYNSVSQQSQIMHAVKGRSTGTKVRVLGKNRWLNSVFYYDKNYRVVQTIIENYIGGEASSGGINKITSKLNFTGQPERILLNHASSTGSLSMLREFTYDHADRLLKTYQTIGGNRVLLSSNKYNDIGQLIEKNLHSTDEGANFLQSVDYRYNIRGWLTSINNSDLSSDGVMNNDPNDLFGMEITYNEQTSPAISDGASSYSPPKMYSGNISSIKWKTDTKEQTPGYSPKQKIYGFDYDILNRLEKAWYATKNGGTWNGDAGLFNESIKSYDKNGNIQGVLRNSKIQGAKGVIDDIDYNYNYTLPTIQDFSGVSNRLLGIQEGTGGSALGFKDADSQLSEEFRYDASGNLIYDHNKQITNISYNYLNLPEVIEFTRPNGNVERIQYVYDANGVKLSTITWLNGNVNSFGTPGWNTEYSGETQYDKGTLSFAFTPEGRVVKNGSNYDYEYFHRDHLGNVRLTFGSLKETVSYRATMENPPSPSTLGSDEVSVFSNNVQNTRYHDSSLPGAIQYNYTKPSERTAAPNASSQTNGTVSNKITGPAIKLHVGSGDKISMEVFAKYTQQPGINAQSIADAALVLATTGAFGITSGESPGLYSGFSSNAPVVPNAGSVSSTLPQAYLAFLFFAEDNSTFVTSGAVAITTSAYNAFEKLERTFSPNQGGYLYIYVANETNVASVNVHFDEMLIVHQKNNNAVQVTQASDYYPFGLGFNAYQSERIKDDYAPVQKNRYGFQGQELQKDLELGWSQFKSRMHDPTIGRFSGVDPLSDSYLHNSTYAFSENKVVRHLELEGSESMDFMTHWHTFGYQAVVSYPADWLQDKIVGGGTRMIGGAHEKMEAHLEERRYEKTNLSEYYPEDIHERNIEQKKVNADIKMAKATLDQLEGYTVLQGLLMGGLEGSVEASMKTSIRSTAIGQANTWDPFRVPFKSFDQMTVDEKKALQHAFSRHGEEFGVSWTKKEGMQAQIDIFNKKASNIRIDGTFQGVQKKPYSQRGSGIPTQSTPSFVYEAEIDGVRYYYYETIWGQFISVGIKTP